MPRLVMFNFKFVISCTLLIYLNLIKDIIAPIINLRDEFDGLDLKSIDIDYFNDDYNKSKPNEMLMDLSFLYENISIPSVHINVLERSAINFTKLNNRMYETNFGDYVSTIKTIKVETTVYKSIDNQHALLPNMSKKLYDIPRGSQGFDNFNQSLGTISIVQMFVLGILSIASSK